MDVIEYIIELNNYDQKFIKNSEWLKFGASYEDRDYFNSFRNRINALIKKGKEIIEKGPEPFSSFANYRARIPFSFGATVANTFLQKLEILQRFDYTNIRQIGFQWMGPYEKEGRYTLPYNLGRGLYPGTFDSLADALSGSYNIKWKIDAFHFVKPLLSVSPPVTSGRAMFTEFHEEPLIVNRYQNDQANLAKLEENQFRYRSYEVHSEGRLNIGLFESFKITNPDIINDSDGSANTVELVAKEIEYTIDHSPGAAGGFMRKIFGVKRLT